MADIQGIPGDIQEFPEISREFPKKSFICIPSEEIFTMKYSYI